MFRKTVAFLLALYLVLGLCACGREIKTDKKIAIITAPKDEYPEDYMVAEALYEAFPDTVILKELPDTRILHPGDPEIMTISEELATQPDVDAIIYARAVRFSSDSILKAKAVNPDLIIAAVEPEDDLDTIASAADFVIACDWAAAAKEIVSAAKAAGAEYFVFFSYPRLNMNSLVADEQSAFEEECKNAGITFVADSGNDPGGGYTDETGIVKAKDVIKERLLYLTNKERIKGENVVLFSADVTVQQTLVELADENGMMYFCPEFPGVFSGLSGAYGVALPDDMNSGKDYVASLKEAVKAKSAGARLYLYNYELMTAFVNAAFYGVAGILQGQQDALPDFITAELERAAKNRRFTVTQNDTSNVFYGYCPAIEKVK
ncbi:MAG: DUF3798 domain-containing protein [Clostridia bacterium]|nr:DUF3798 domain-containing protein [Clostridia bacterium]